MHISRKNVYSILILCLEFVPIVSLRIFPTPAESLLAMHRVGIIALICFVLSFIAIWRECKELNAFVYFLIFVYIFSFGQCFMSIMGQELRNNVFSLSRGYFDGEAIIDSSIFVLLAIEFTCFGYLIFYPRNKRTTKKQALLNEENYAYRSERARRFGWIFLAIGIIPTFYGLYQEYQTLLTFGYAATLVAQTGIMRILGLVSGFFMSGVLLLYCYEKKHRKSLYLIVALYVLLQVAGGSRVQVFRIAIVFLLIEDLYFKKMNRRRWLFVIFLGIIAALVLSIVSSVRAYLYLSNDMQSLLTNSFKNLWKNNFLFASINEMGNTQVINTLVLNKCPNPIPFQFGLSYLKMIWAILPNLLGEAYTGYIGIDITFSPLYTITDSGMGASYICEGYWNFGYLSLFFFAAFGLLCGWIVSKFRNMCKGKEVDPAKFFLVVYVIYWGLFLVRSESLEFGRSFVYYAVIPYLCIMNRKGHKKIKGNDK